MEAGFLFPPPDLVPILNRVWGWRSNGPEWVGLPMMGPGVGAELVFSLGSPLRSDRRPLPAVMLFHQIGQAIPLDRQQGLDIVSLRVRAGALRHCLPMPVEEVPEGLHDAEALWGSGVRRLRQILGHIEGFPQRAEILITWLREQRNRHMRPDPSMRRIIGELYDLPGRPAIRTSDMGLRQLQRRFKQATGTTLKAFQQKVRLYRILRGKALDPSARVLDLALEQGFFDQAHFCHTFRQITGMSPGAFLHEMENRSHFYNPPDSGHP